MKDKTLFALFLFVLMGSILAIAQQPPYSHKWETKRILWEQSGRRDHIFDEPNVSINPPHYLQYNADITILNTIIPDFQVNENAGPNGTSNGSPAISTDGSGNFVITWEDRRNERFGDIYAQRYAFDCTVLDTNFKVNDDLGSYQQYDPSISTDSSGNFVITWGDNRNRAGDDIFAQRYASDGSVLGTNFEVNDDLRSARQFDPDVRLWNNRIYSTWTDTRAAGTGYDIWANVLDWENPVRINDNLSQVSTAFILSQNYPNPFNSSTKISYLIPKSSFVILKIYDMLGREIQAIVNEFQKADTYSVNFDASELSSGVYFYSIRAGNNFVETKKMLFMK